MSGARSETGPTNGITWSNKGGSGSYAFAPARTRAATVASNESEGCGSGQSDTLATDPCTGLRSLYSSKRFTRSIHRISGTAIAMKTILCA